ncbi:MAG: hypothetical protein ABGW98_17110, partial [Myxococcales bacterium]
MRDLRLNRPGLDGRTGQHIQLENMEFPENVRSFAQYLQENGLVRPVEWLADEQLAVRSDDVLEWIRTRGIRSGLTSSNPTS